MEPIQMRAESSPLLSLWPWILPWTSPWTLLWTSAFFDLFIFSDQENFSFTKKKWEKNLPQTKLRFFLIPTPSLFAQN